MIPVLYAMIRARRTQALAMLLLSAIAALAAVAGPAYLHHVDANVVGRQVIDASAAQRSIDFTVSLSPEQDSQTYSQIEPQLTTTLATMPGFATVTSTDIAATLPAVGGGDGRLKILLVSRQDACDHITMLRGRCMQGVAEVVIATKIANAYHLRPGDAINLVTTVYNADTRSVEASSPFQATVTGVYAPTAPAEPYWGPSAYFAAGGTPPILTDDATLAAMPESVGTTNTLAIAAASTYVDDLPKLSGQVVSAEARAEAQQVRATTSIPDLIATIQANEAIASGLIPVAAVPLVMLAWFVIFLAAAYAASATRFEHGVVALRGTPRGLRWWLAAGENIAMIVIGTFASYGVVALFAPVSITWTLIALAGSIVAALVAVIRPVTSSAAPLLRRVPAGVSGAANRIARIAEILIVVAAIATAVQLRLAGGNLRGVTLLVPGLIILGTAVAGSFAVIPIARRIGRRAVERGRVATALAAFGIGRRPGAQRVLVLTAVAVGLLAFATAGLSVASIGRSDLATVQTGAPRVVSVGVVSRTQLIAAVDATDPTGTWAMASVDLPAPTPGVPPTIAIDATRLAAVSTWSPAYGPLTAAQVGALLHPSEYAPPAVITATSIAVDATSTGLTRLYGTMSLSVDLVPLDGSDPVTVYLGTLTNGPTTVGSSIPCDAGCRIAGFAITQAGSSGYVFHLRIDAVRAGGSVTIGNGSDWHVTNGGSAAADPAGPTIALDSRDPSLTRVTIAAVPSPLPVVTTSRLPDSVSIALLDTTPAPVVDAAVVPGLPRLGRYGTFVDLRYAELLATDNDVAIDPQVWLGPAAPPDAVARLEAHGLSIGASTTPAIEAQDLDQQGPAQALLFHVVAALLAVLLAIGALLVVAVVDRRPRTEELAALRVQGVSARTVGRAASAGYATVMIVASLIGLLAGVLAWWVVGGNLPMFTASQQIWPAPAWPHVMAVAWPWLVGLAVLGAVAVAAGIDLRRAIRNR